MKNILIAVAASAIIVSAVVVVKYDNKTKNNLLPESDYVSCSDICAKKMLSDCDTVKGDFKNCSANCERWTPSMKACVKKASDCAQLDLDFSRSEQDLRREERGLPISEEDKIAKASHCTVIDDDYSDISEEEPQKETQFGCSGACYKYKQCAGFGQNISEKDKNDAYDSCFTECQKWSQKTLFCMKKVSINSPADCAPLTMCALAEYKNTK